MALDQVPLTEINERTVESVEQDQTTEIMRTDLSVHSSSNESTVVDESGERRARSDCRSMPGDLSAHSTKKKIDVRRRQRRMQSKTRLQNYAD